jgi:phenylacetate-CoA ligase
MDRQSMQNYHGKLLRFRPVVLYGYPSALVELARFIESRGLQRIAVQRIITTAERLTPAYRRLLEEQFEGEVFDLYATRDYGCIGFECARHEGYHIDVGSVYIEIINDGHPVAPGETGEIVVTDLLNYGMPMIRSRTGDMGALAPAPCECGSPLPLLQGLDGRASDVVFRTDGTMVPGLILTDFCADIEAIRLIQFIQKTLDRIDVLVVATDGFSEQARQAIARHVQQVMGDQMTVHVERVGDLERNPRSGKLREILCTVDKASLAARSAGSGRP